ncbi:TwdlO [Drosophila busckii]|uniref:TwdlO n=1 Tax=Drosophila busckii TaxID=30019 RepID=A0A0M4ENA8_DROBS|nr:TwdlO [Drosophila busckii]
MRFLIALCLIGAACAQYSYNPGFSGSSSGSIPSVDYLAPAGSESSYNSAYAPVSGGLNKEFYTFEADENDFHDAAGSERIANSVNKGLRVVFIKGPENRGLENAALALAKQAAEQRTAIYVLNKQHDLNELAQKFNAVRNNVNNKPEVHFVKYRTPEDAANAQRAIQSEYDQLGGSSQNFNGGVASAINFASQSPHAIGHVSHGGASNFGALGAGSAPAPINSYLPANILRRLRVR